MTDDRNANLPDDTDIADVTDVPEAPEAHHFVFGDDGKVVAFTHIGDWAVHEAAMPGGRPLEIAHATA